MEREKKFIELVRQEPTRGRVCPSSCTRRPSADARHPVQTAATTIKTFDHDDDDDVVHHEDELERVERCHTLAWRRKRKKRVEKHLEFDDFAMHQDPMKALQIVPTMAMPFVANVVKETQQDFDRKTEEGKKKKKKKLKTQLSAIAKFASATLGRGLGVHDRLAAQARARALAWSAETYRRRTSDPPVPREISRTAQIYLEETFRVQCVKGALKRPVIQVEFDYPRSLSACCACSSTDFLFVFVGLFNIFVVQCVLVIIMFFSDKELDLSSIESYYKPPTAAAAAAASMSSLRPFQ